MRGLKIAIGVVPALLATTALVQAQDAGGHYALSATGGVVALNLPDLSVPVFTGGGVTGFSNSLDSLALGALVGVSGSASLGAVGEYEASIGVSGFAALARRSIVSSQTLSGIGTVVIPGITTPPGTITLVTNQGAPSGSSDISGTATTDQTVAIPVNGGGGQNAFGTVQDIPGQTFSLAAGHSFNGAPANNAASYGAIASTAGGIFVGVGDLTGLKIETTSTNDILYAGADISFALSGLANNAIVQGYAGPSYRFLGQRGKTTVSVDIPEQMPFAPADYMFPTYSQTTNDDLDSHYLGGVVGGGVTLPAGDGATSTLGGEGGLYHVATSYTGTESYTLSGGNPAIVLGTQTVTNATTLSETASGLAWALRGQGSSPFRWMRPNSSALVAPGVLSRVATVARSGAAATITQPDADDLTYTGPGAGSNSMLSFGDMWAFSGTVSLTGQF